MQWSETKSDGENSQIHMFDAAILEMTFYLFISSFFSLLSLFPKSFFHFRNGIDKRTRITVYTVRSIEQCKVTCRWNEI